MTLYDNRTLKNDRSNTMQRFKDNTLPTINVFLGHLKAKLVLHARDWLLHNSYCVMVNMSIFNSSF